MTTAVIPCRLCGAGAEPAFSLRLLGQFEISYYRCAGCGSLETEVPYWLPQAYAETQPHPLDVGSAQRNLRNHAFILLLARLLRIRTTLDFGGGDGLLCRLLRDSGLDARTQDEYATSTYAGAFTGTLGAKYDLITAFEVLEHLPEPKRVLDGILETQPRYFLATTELFSGQGKDWWYFVPEAAQHVFFYSHRGMKQLAERHGYWLEHYGGYHLFSQQPMRERQRRIVRLYERPWFARMLRAWLAYRMDWEFITKDYETIRQERGQEQRGGDLNSA